LAITIKDVEPSRSAATNAIITFSRVWTGTSLTPEKEEILARMETELIDTTSRFTGLTKDQTTQLFDSSKVLTPEEARQLGIIDHVR
jgi:ATP-dependent protease ClpP protease subunit